jgi:hypothetical protein
VRRYQDPSGRSGAGRDARLDLLRGYAVFAMSVNHLGLGRGVFSPFTGGSVFLINAAEVFFFVSGLTLGLISRRRDLGSAASRCYRRCWQVYLSVLFLAAGGLALGEAGLGDGGLWGYIGMVASLREAPFWSDVLVAYVVYLLIAPALLALLVAGRTRVSVAAIAGLYLISQLDPNGMPTPVASFRNLAANGPLFLGGIVLGWHRNAVFSWWGSRRWRVAADAGVVTLGLCMLAVYATGYRPLPEAWAAAAEETFDLGTREYRMPPVALAVVAVYLRCLWLVVDRGWGLLRPAMGWLALPLGRAALTGYVAHAFLIAITWRVVERTGASELAESPWGGALIGTLYTLAMLAVVHAARLLRAWWAAGPRREVFRHPASGAALAGMFVLGAIVGERWEDEGWSDESFELVSQGLWDRFGEFDREDAPLVVEPLPVSLDEDEPRVEAEHIAWQVWEIVADEERPGRPVVVAFRWLGGEGDLEREAIANILEEIDEEPRVLVVPADSPDAANADTYLLAGTTESWAALEDDPRDELLDHMGEAMATARARNGRSLLIVMPGFIP